MRFVEEFGVNIVGGCCGTMPEHMKMLAVDAVGKPPAEALPRRLQAPAAGESRASLHSQEIRQDLSYLVVAERTNTNGSRQSGANACFRRTTGVTASFPWRADEMKEGSHMLDVCVDFCRPQRRPA